MHVYSGDDSGKGRHQGWRRIALPILYLLSSGLIIGAGAGNLWLDEIWSIHFVKQADTVAELLFRFKHDNNHLLNSIYLYYLGEQPFLISYRIMAILAGITSIFTLGHTAQRNWSRSEAIVCVLLAGTSFPLVLYFSEARGYALAIFFAVLAYAILNKNSESLRPHRLLLYWAASILGLLSHATFAMVSTALIIMHLFHTLRDKDDRPNRMIGCFVYQLPPVVAGGLLYLWHIRHMHFGGGPIYGKVDVITRATAFALGFPTGFPYAVCAFFIFATIVVAGTRHLHTERQPHWIFFPCILLLTPACLLVITQPTYLYFRYFILCFPFFYLLLAYMLCRWYRTWSPSFRLVLIFAVAVLITSGHMTRIIPLITLGRGNYQACLTYMAANSPDPEISVGSDHDFRTTMLFQFYLPRVVAHKKWHYIRISELQEMSPRWFITHSQELLYRPQHIIHLGSAGTYHLNAEFRYAGVSGWHWFLYKRQGGVEMNEFRGD